MHRLRSRRKGIETVVGGLIVLVLLLLSLVAMTALTGQYDAFQSTAAIIQQKNTDKYSENIQVIIPGIIPLAQVGPTSCGGGWCNAYNITLNNLGIGLHIAGIYINSTQLPGCTTLCVLNPGTSNSPAPFTFQSRQSYINSGEFYHGIVFWLPWDPTSHQYTLPLQCAIGGVQVNYNCSTITIVTSRGRSFSFQWPFSPSGPAVGAGGGGGGTGIYIGPVVYTYQKSLVAYTTHALCSPSCNPTIPIGGTNGYWIVPTGSVIMYVKLQADIGVKNDIYLTTHSVMELELYTSPGTVAAGTIIAPIQPAFCAKFHAQDPTITCDSSGSNWYGYYAGGNSGDPNSVVPYVTCAQSPPTYDNAVGHCSSNPRYRIPKPNAAQLAAGQRGSPVVIAFAFTGGNAVGNWAGNSVLTFLGLSYVWDDGSGSGAYVYGVTLPFVALCVNDGGTKCSG